MQILKIQFYLFAIIGLSFATPFIFEDSIEYCNYTLTNLPNKWYETNSTTLHVKFDSVQINFKLCGTFSGEDKCPEGTVACMENYKTGKKEKFVSNFILATDNQLKAFSKDHQCSLIVHLQSAGAQLSYDKSEENCIYHIKLKLDPITTKKCGITVSNRYLDLSSLANSYTISNSGRNFSIILCKEDMACQNNSINACEFKDGNIIPLSEYSSFNLVYEDGKLEFRGVTHVGENRKINKRLDITLKCNWNKSTIQSGDLTYVKKQTQGKKYSFELETSYGCIKNPISCVLHVDNWVYDLSKLYKEHPGIRNTYGSNNSSFFMQICGPANLTDKSSSCKDSYAQVCESVNGMDINRGSILSHLQVTEFGLRATIDTGSICKNKTHYRSLIDFRCDIKEDGPKFLRYDDCDTYFQWKTPHACPRLNSTNCAYTHQNSNCTFFTQDNYYNLNSLNTTKTLKDNQNSNIEFKFNICGPVNDLDTKCMSDVSVIMKNLNEPNRRYSVTSLGKFLYSTTENNDLILKYSTGAYCSHGNDYKSAIHIQCSDKQEEPLIFKQDICYYEFLWKSPYGCVKSKNETKCSFVETRGEQRVDFGYLTPIELEIDKRRLIFHVCEGFYLNCTAKGNCSNEKLKSPTLSIKDTITLQFNFETRCSLPESFNSITVNFVCDKIKNNEHLGSWVITECNLKVDYFTNFVCSFKKNAVKKELPIEKVLNCHIKSPDTKQEFNLLNLPNDFFKTKCPVTTVFNDSFRYLKLFYPSADVCQPIPSKNISYEVYLFCANEANISDRSEDCRQHFSYKLPELCNFFTTQKKFSVLLIVGSVIGGLLLLGLVIFGLVVRRRKTFCSRSRGLGFNSIYERVNSVNPPIIGTNINHGAQTRRE